MCFQQGSFREYFRSLIDDEHIRSDLDERSGYGSAADRYRDRSPATTVPFLAANVLRQVKVGDALLVNGALPPAWIRTRANAKFGTRSTEIRNIMER